MPRHQDHADFDDPGDHVVVMAEVFGMLSDPGRLRLLLALRNAPERTVTELVDETGIAQSAVSHALRLLRAYRVVGVRRQGRRAFYTITDDHVRLLLDATLEHLRSHHALARDVG
jgi:ArsR family transcriptional regulator, lead/cadmium/zinc/bismuth-responsive transcriptional repressor